MTPTLASLLILLMVAVNVAAASVSVYFAIKSAIAMRRIERERRERL